MAKSKESAIPITENSVFAVHVDTEKKKETILIGEMADVKKYMDDGEDSALLFSSGRDLGLLLQDFIPVAGDMADIRAALMDSTGRKPSALFPSAVHRLTDMYQSENPVYRFTALLMWQECHHARKNRIAAETLFDTFDDISLSLRYYVIDDVLQRQEANRKNPLAYLDMEFHKYPVLLYYDKSNQAREYGCSNISLLPLVSYYLKRIYEAEKYIQVCPLCGKAFIAKTAGMTTFCSAECKRESLRLNKRRFDEKAKSISYERASKNTYMYWYNKITKLRKENLPKKKTEEAELLFSAYCEEAAKRKKSVITGGADATGFEAWLLMQRNVIDEFIDGIRGGK
jgi:endogenous inhibitor of DNA gyrase (YacG/DUF329 family)